MLFVFILMIVLGIALSIGAGALLLRPTIAQSREVSRLRQAQENLKHGLTDVSKLIMERAMRLPEDSRPWRLEELSATLRGLDGQFGYDAVHHHISTFCGMSDECWQCTQRQGKARCIYQIYFDLANEILRVEQELEAQELASNSCST